MSEERKLVTVIFVDIVGSTALTVARDPEIVRAMMRRTYDELRKILVAHEGTVEKFIGDAVMAVFGVPHVHDDDADRAVRAAFAMLGRMRELSALPNAVALELRIGINSGEAVAGTGEGGEFLVTGEPVNAAARLQQSAAPGEIVVGALTHRLTRGGVGYGEARSIAAKGIGHLEAWIAESLQSSVPEQHRGVEGLHAPLIGRDEELRLLVNGYERMRAETRPQLVTVFGAAGAGKSRLTEELILRLDGARVRQGRCLPYGEGISLWPIQLILRADAGIAPSDDLDSARQRIRAAVVEAFPANADDIDAVRRRLEVLAGLARADEAMPDVKPADLSDELAWGLRRYLERRAAGEPLVLVFEDIHWAAPALLELIEHLSEWAKAPLFLLCLARPEFLDARPGWGGGKVNAASIVLEPLTPEETRELVARLLDIDALNEDVRGAVIERAEGNPLYVEEFIRLLIESGRIVQQPDGQWIAAGVAPLQVPPTLQGLIAARLDTAPAEVKRLLQRGAVIGRFFPTTGIAALDEGRLPESAQLRDAVRRDLIVDVDERGVGGGRVYRFKHVLIREVVYGSLPKTERAVLHDRYVRWYEETLGDRREDFIDLIAYHAEQAYLLAGEMGLPEASDLARRAFDRLVAAAMKPWKREDGAAALALFTRASAPAADAELTPLERLDLDAHLALAHHRVEATHDALAAIDAAIARARALGATKVLIELLENRVWFFTGQQREEGRRELRSLALATQDPEQIVKALIWRIDDTSPFSDDIAYLSEALEYATVHELPDWRVRCLTELTWRHRIQMRFTEAQRTMDEWERLLGASPSRRERSLLLWQKAGHLVDVWHAEASLPLWDEIIVLLRDLGDPRGSSRAQMDKSSALAQMGRYDDAIALNAEVIAAVEGKNAPMLKRRARLWQADCLASVADLGAARAMLEAGRGLAYLPNAVDWQLPLVSAVVAAAEGDAEAAVPLLGEVATEFQRTGLISPAFVFDQARVLLQAGRATEARRVLEDLRATLGDPLADRLRGRTDALLAQCAAAATGTT